jgi:hypothetical protein
MAVHMFIYMLFPERPAAVQLHSKQCLAKTDVSPPCFSVDAVVERKKERERRREIEREREREKERDR